MPNMSQGRYLSQNEAQMGESMDAEFLTTGNDLLSFRVYAETKSAIALSIHAAGRQLGQDRQDRKRDSIISIFYVSMNVFIDNQ